jgi:hypothetical protein
MISISSCLEGKYVEKSYTFVDFETEDGGIDGICIRDVVSDDVRYHIYFNHGSMKFRFFYHLLEGPYRVRFDFSNSITEVEKIIINNIILETSSPEESLLKNIWEIESWNVGEFNQAITPEKLNEFYNTQTVEFDNSVSGFSIGLHDINISYASEKNIILKFNITVYLKNGQIHNIDKNYTLTRYKDVHEGSYK